MFLSQGPLGRTFCILNPELVDGFIVEHDFTSFPILKINADSYTSGVLAGWVPGKGRTIMFPLCATCRTQGTLMKWQLSSGLIILS